MTQKSSLIPMQLERIDESMRKNSYCCWVAWTNATDHTHPKHNKTQPVEVALKSWSIRRHLLFGLVPDLHHQHDVGSWWFCRHFIFKRFCIWTTHILGWARVRFSLRDLQTTHESLGKRMLALQLASHKRHPKGTAIPLHSKMNLNEVERFSTSMERGFGCTQKMISCDIILSCMSPV